METVLGYEGFETIAGVFQKMEGGLVIRKQDPTAAEQFIYIVYDHQGISPAIG